MSKITSGRPNDENAGPAGHCPRCGLPLPGEKVLRCPRCWALLFAPAACDGRCSRCRMAACRG